jgi:hypothetical protein
MVTEHLPILTQRHLMNRIAESNNAHAWANVACCCPLVLQAWIVGDVRALSAISDG